MTGTFSSFNTALSALRYNRVAMDVASGNIANVGTQGYTRRRVEAESVGAPMVTAMWSRYDGHGDGVRVQGITRLTDAFIDARQRTEHGNQSYLDVTADILTRVESGIGEPGGNGVTKALQEFHAGWHDLANHPESSAARSQMVARTADLVEVLRGQATQISTETAGQAARLDAVLAEVNTVAADLGSTNASIAVGTVNGDDVSTLLDQRDQLALRLAELTGAKAVEGSQGNLDVTIGGVPLVTGKDAGTLAVTGSPPSLSFTITGAGGPGGAVTAVPAAGMRGEAGAVTDVLDLTLPTYLSDLNAVARSLADSVNAQHALGYDADGNPGGAVFTYTAGNEALSLASAITDGSRLAASGLAGASNLDGSNAVAIDALRSPDDLYERLVNGFGTEVASMLRLAGNQQVLTNQVNASHDQLAGVNLDEEMANLVVSQHAFEAASRVITTLDDMLDTLINRTGLVR